MAINYTNLFGDLGEIVLAVEELEAMMVTMESRRSSMITQFDASGVTDLINQINTTFDTFINSIESNINLLLALGRSRISDRETVVEELTKLSSTGFDSVMLELISDMVGSQTILKSTVTASVTGETTTNTDVGDLIVSKLLPGDKNPGQGMKRNRFMAGVDSELAIDDTIRVVCNKDSQQGSSEGSETFTISGIQPQQRNPFANQQGGSKGIGNLTVGNAGNLITNFFSTFTVADTPDDWIIDSGTPTTDFQEETVDFFDDDSSLRLVAGGTPQLRYNIYPVLVPGATLTLYFYLKRDATASGTLTVDLDIDGVSKATEAIAIGAAQDDWARYSYVFTVPVDIGDDDGTTFLRFTGGVTTADLLIDGGVLVPMTWFGGIGFVVTRGKNKFILDDVFDVSFTNDDAGKFSRFFTRGYGWQLPSSGTPSISDP